MTNLIAALKYWPMIIAVVKMVEQMVPDNTPGAAKLDAALKALIKMDDSIQNLQPEVTKLIAGAKAIYNAFDAKIAAA